MPILSKREDSFISDAVSIVWEVKKQKDYHSLEQLLLSACAGSLTLFPVSLSDFGANVFTKRCDTERKGGSGAQNLFKNALFGSSSSLKQSFRALGRRREGGW